MTLDVDGQRLVAAFREEVDHLQPDLTTLAFRAAREGAGLRRRTSARLGVLAAACVVVAGVGGVALLDHTGGDGREPTQHASNPPPTPQPALQPARARSVAAALLEQVREQVPGVGSGYAGQDDAGVAGPLNLSDADRSVYSELVFTPEATGEPGFVGINLQAQSPFARSDYRCGGPLAASDVGRTDSCERRVRDNGTVVLLIQDVGTLADGTEIVERRADSLHPDGLRVLVRSSNTADDAKASTRHGGQVSAEPALDLDQVTSIVTWPTWAMELPARYAAAGAKLRPFDDFSQTRAELCGDGQKLVQGRCV